MSTSRPGWVEPIAIAKSDGTAHATAAALSILPTHAKKLLPGSYYDTINQMLWIKASGRVSTVITTPGTLRFDVRLGGVVVFDGQAILPDTVQAHVNVPWDLEIFLTLREIGTVAQFFGYGRFTCEDILGAIATPPKGVLSAPLPWNAAPAVGATFDATVANVLDLFLTQVVATHSLTLHQYVAMNVG